MKIRLSLKYRIITGLILLSSLFALFSIMIVKQINNNEKLREQISINYQPSISKLSNLFDLHRESQSLFLYWGVSDISNDSLFRNENKILFQSKIFSVLDQLTNLSVNWNPEDRELYYKTSALIRDSLYFSYIDLIVQVRADKRSGSNAPSIKTNLEQGDIINLNIEIEQNLNYLLGKHQLEMDLAYNQIGEGSLKIRKNVLGFTAVIILVLIMVSYLILIYASKLLKKFTSNIQMLAQGIIPDQIIVRHDDEFDKVFIFLNNVFGYLKNLTFISKKIIQKEFNTDFKPLSEKDELGIALCDLQYNLKLATEEEQRHKKEDSERSWMSEGIARINEILRSSSDRLEDLSYNLIKEIVEYTSSKIGALYILNNSEPDEPLIELLAAYAFDRKKFLNKKIAIGEGLVGRCVQENETIFLTDVPKAYLTIKSGMGESQPASILIVPIHLNENVYGVIEIAAFAVFETYKIRFVETIGESIATTISKVKINLQTTQLLAQTRMQAEEMSAQEEEMRQNMEELRVTQEQMAIREEKLTKEIELLRQQLKGK